ncbi:membrane protein [Devosia geojensis]|uniref:Membrane protein n=1 Tax=Devosia geojensis TaxID=443610 RepID=A0A0F5FWZ2_9HYPH|nr:SHOCT domain-containing protein [Devosia geojensis]KKB13353.1 membrane protein [Devosia geojensis]
MMSNFWDFLWLLVSAFLLISYLMVLFQIIADLFRDTQLGGFGKALWIIALLVLPLLTALVYVIVRGGGMTRRYNESISRARAETDEYIRETAGRSPAAEIAQADALLKSGTITEAEFRQLKAKALA